MQQQHSSLQAQSPGQIGGNSLATNTMVSAAGLPPPRQHSEDSWVEVASRPSSSSLSSATDEIITTGLRVHHDSNLHRRRRRRARTVGQFQIGTGYRVTSAGGDNSSQEEYDESESESDRVMTSSNEGIGPSPLQNELRRSNSIISSDTLSEREGDDEDEDDENATAVNYPRSSRRQFEPRPNAFSHPSTQPAIRSQSGTVYAPRRPAARPLSQRHSYPQHTPYNGAPPNAQADHDEALRASLSTLLTAAAAVRGLPKPGQPRTVPSNPSGHPTSLRLVPESVALGEEDGCSNPVSTDGPSLSPRTVSSDPSDKSKRKATPPHTATRSSSKERRAVKKARRTGPLVEEISPTLLTWVVGAGAVVLVSALSFSAGYVVGKEAGHADAMSQIGSVGEAGRCGKEAASGLRGAGMGLRRLRWSGGSGVRV